MRTLERDARPDTLIGEYVGPYRIVEPIGRGGMAVVYKAVQRNLNRYVAVKVLPAHLVHDAGFRTRFQREAELVATLEHPNILPIYDYGQHGDVPYIVMPYAAGGTLSNWLASGTVSLDQGVQVLVRVLSALAHAHSHGVVHRDVKPSNILMGRADWPLLTDFGIAKIVAHAARVTRSGLLVGTPEYMAPEQSQVSEVDARADLYAVGVVLFQFLTGRLPFEAPTPVGLILQHVNEAIPSVRSLNPTLPPLWDHVIGRAMAKQPADRFQTAEAFATALQEAMERTRRVDLPRTVTAVGAPPPSRTPQAGGQPPPLAPTCAVERLSASHAAPVVPPSRPAEERAASELASAPRTPSTPAPAVSPAVTPAPAIPSQLPIRRDDHPADLPPAARAWTASARRALETRIGKRGAVLRWLLPIAGMLAGLLVVGSLGWGPVPRPPTPSAPTATPQAANLAKPLGATAVPTTTATPTVVPTPTAAELFTTCQAAVEAGTWDEARQRCEAVRAADAAHAGLASALARTHVGQGKERLASHDFDGAERAFTRAVAADATDAEALRQLSLLKAYRAGEAALGAQSWPTAAERLEVVYADDPDYALSAPGGGVRDKIFAARLGWGRALLNAGDYAEAQRRCEQALEVKPDNAEAATCRSTAVAAQATPTPIARAANVVQPTPKPVAPAAAPTAKPAATAQPTARPANPPAPTPQPTSRPAVAAQPTPRPAVAAQPTPRPAATAVPPTRGPASNIAVPPTRGTAASSGYTPRY